MKNEMKKLRVCSKKKVLRLVQTGEIGFVNGKFMDQFGKPLDLQYKTKYRDDLDDDIGFDDFLDKSGSFAKDD